MKAFLVVLLLIYIPSLFANEKERLSFLKKEVVKIKKYMKDSGEDPDLRRLLHQYKKEEEAIVKKIKEREEMARAKKAPAPKKASQSKPVGVKVVKRAAVKPKADLIHNPVIRRKQVTSLLAKERQNYLSLLSRGEFGPQMDQSLANIANVFQRLN